ncbi:unnamed protein product, partial [Larinioides sclopetarius]
MQEAPPGGVQWRFRAWVPMQFLILMMYPTSPRSLSQHLPDTLYIIWRNQTQNKPRKLKCTSSTLRICVVFVCLFCLKYKNSILNHFFKIQSVFH